MIFHGLEKDSRTSTRRRGEGAVERVFGQFFIGGGKVVLGRGNGIPLSRRGKGAVHSGIGLEGLEEFPADWISGKAGRLEEV